MLNLFVGDLRNTRNLREREKISRNARNEWIIVI